MNQGNNSILHPWNLSTQEAGEIQKSLVGRLILEGEPHADLIAGVDCSYTRFSDDLYTAIVLYSLKKRMIVELATSCTKAEFPYISGFLAFREGPAVLAAWKKLKRKPGAVIFDGQGIAHPRRLGLAAHLGLWLNLPSVGCGKTRLCGTAREPDFEAGSYSRLLDGKEQIGVVLRTKAGVKPVFVSPGHLVSMEGSRNLILAACQGYRLPEPTRLAHIEVNRFRNEMTGS